MKKSKKNPNEKYLTIKNGEIQHDKISAAEESKTEIKKPKIYVYWVEEETRTETYPFMFQLGNRTNTYHRNVVVDSWAEAYKYRNKRNVHFIEGTAIYSTNLDKKFKEVQSKKEEILKKLTPEEKKILGL